MIIVYLLIALSFGISVYFYPALPEVMVTHWGISGQPDGYSPKAMGIFLFPVMLCIMGILFIVIPRLDPKKNNIQSFRHIFVEFIAVLFAFMVYVQILVAAWNLGWTFEMSRLLAPAFGLLFLETGRLMLHAKPNWFIGIRTPWTLSSDTVWKKTHQVGGKLFMAVGALSFGGVLFPKYLFGFMFVPIMAATVFVFIYSYILYKDESHHAKH